MRKLNLLKSILGLATFSASLVPMTAPVIAQQGDFPLYQYQTKDLNNKNSPINIAWKDNTKHELTAKKVAEEMREGGWRNSNPAVQVFKSNQHIKTSNGYANKTDAHVMKAKRKAGHLAPASTAQYHIRLYNYEGPEADVIGQVHYDPLTHGQIRRYLREYYQKNMGIFIDNNKDIYESNIAAKLNVNWKLTKAREKAVNFWEKAFGNDISITTIDANNTETSDRYGSHDGKIKVINLGKGVDFDNNNCPLGGCSDVPDSFFPI